MKDRTHYIPKYFKISNEIIRKIENRKLLPGTQLPSENEIVKIYQVSNTTARKVLMELELGGWAYRVKGKGTFVKDFIIHRSASKILSFTKNMEQRGLTPTTRLLDGKLIHQEVTKTISGRKFRMKAPLYQINRLRLADGIPMMKEIRYISLGQCPGMDKLNLEQSLYDIYRKEYNLHINHIEQMLTSVIMQEELLKIFDLKENTPGFLVEGVTFHGNNLILEMEESIYRGDKYTFSVRAVP